VRNLVKLFLFVSIAWLATLTGPAFAQVTGANSTGNWNDPTIWTTGLVPASSDNVYIGSTYPTGAAGTATVTLTEDESASYVYVGYGSPTSGMLDLDGNKLTITNGLTIGDYLGTGIVTEEAGGSFSAANLIMYTDGTSFTFGTSDTTGTIDIENGAALTTTATGNITGGGSVANGSTLNLGASASFSGGLNVEGAGATLNLDGNNLSVNTLDLGYFFAAVTLERGSGTPGTLAVNTLNLGNSQNLALIAGDTISGAGGTANIYDGATLTTASSSNITTGVNVDGGTLNLGANLNIGSNSMNVEASGTTLNLNGYNFTAKTLDLGYDSSSAVTFERGTSTQGVLTLNYLYLGNGQNLSLIPGDTITGPTGGVNIYTGAVLTTAATSNINDDTVNVVGGTLNLGAALNITNQPVNAENGAILNLNGYNLTAANLLLGFDGTSTVTLNRGSSTQGQGALSLGFLYLGNSQNLNLISSDTIGLDGDSANIEDSATLTTASSANISSAVNVETGGTLNLGASLSLSGNLNVQDMGSVFNAQGQAVSASEIFFGSNGTAPVTVSNLGKVTTSQLFVGNGTSVSLHGGDVISNSATVESGGTLNLGASLSLFGNLNV
jgi:hypothetical protein